MAATLVLDFDGTVVCADVGDEICDRFGDPSWRELDRAWERREIALPDAQRAMWAGVAAGAAELREFARACGRVRPGLDELLATAAARGVDRVLASGGFDFYIEAILGERVRGFQRVYANHGELRGGRVRVSFPHRAALGCALCAVCKGRVCDRERAAGRRVIFAGDGTSDRCAIGRADELWAVRGGKLAAAAGSRCREFEDLREIAEALARDGGTVR